jgi:lipopolysaccharide export system protein LptA
MNILTRNTSIFYLGLACLLCSVPSSALDSDKNAPVAIKADTTSIDFRTGKRVLTGNVEVSQGTMYIAADKIVLVYAGDKIDTATAYGNPVKFRQMPEGQTELVHGEGKKLLLEQAKNLVTLIKNAKLTQSGSVITGKVIYYDTLTSKMTVKSESSGSQEKTAGNKKKADKAAESKTESGRTRILIQPGSMDKK